MFKADEFWQFSLALYARNGVKELCLTLQDEHGFNVNVLLLSCYLNLQGVFYNREQYQQILSSITESEQTLALHRAVRKAAKQKDVAKYQQLLKQELALEKHQQDKLIVAINLLTPATSSSHNNLEIYADIKGKSDCDGVRACMADLLVRANITPKGDTPVAN